MVPRQRNVSIGGRACALDVTLWIRVRERRHDAQASNSMVLYHTLSSR